MIDHYSFHTWAESRFTDIQISGDEIKVNSPFTEDQGQHLWCNTKKNAFHCWKSEEHGNLWDLVCYVDKCSYEQAHDILGGDFILHRLEEKLREMYKKKKEVKKKKEEKLELPPYTYEISSLTASRWRNRAVNYLTSRKLSIENLFICTSGQFADRIIIPYYDKNGSLIYFNGRSIGNLKPKYKGPTNIIVGKGDVLWMSSWNCDKIYLCEGEFDAMSLYQCGLNGAACGGKEVTNKQIQMLHPYHVVLAFDQDKSGFEALNKVGKNLLGNNIHMVSYVRPPEGIKDWNSFLVKYDKNRVSNYILHEEKQFTIFSEIVLRNKVRLT
jgi:DNA primase